MRRVVGILLSCLLLAGCSQNIDEIERGIALRGRLLKAASCSFEVKITADYGDNLYEFAMSCQGDNQGNLRFAVTEPQSIGGITGEIRGEKGSLTFDDTVLPFELMADDQVTPVSAPWIVYKTLLGGYITSGCTEEEGLRLTIDDRYEEEALTLDIWLDPDDLPKRAEILYKGRRILTVSIQNFVIV